MFQNDVSVIPTFGFDRRDVKERYAYVTLAPSTADQKKHHQQDGYNYNSSFSVSNNNNSAQHDETAQLKSPIMQAFGPIIFSLRLCGLMFNRLETDDSKNVSKGLPAPGMIYCWFITILGWVNVLLTFSALRMVTSIGRDLLTALIATAWQLLMTLNATGMLRNAHNPAYRKRFFRGFLHLDDFGGFYVDANKLKKHCAVLNAVFWVLSVGNTVFINYGMFNTEVYDIILANIISVFPNPRFIFWVKIVNIGMTFYFSTMWLFPVCLELAIGWLLRTEFDLFRKAFSARLAAERGQTKSIETERKRFLEMTKIVEAADNCLAIHHGAVFLCDIANICFMLYMLAYLPTPPTSIAVSFSLWVVAWLADMAVVCWVGIIIDSGARKISTLLLEINVGGVTNDIALEVTLFLRNVDEFFGFTVCRLFTINRTVILSLVGMLITYFLLIVQFASTATAMNGCQSQCNCTDTSDMTL